MRSTSGRRPPDADPGAPAPRSSPPRSSPPKIESIVPGVHPGDHDLGIASVHQPAHLLEHRLRLAAPGDPAGLRHDAKGAGLVAAFLDLHERSPALAHFRDRHLEELAGLGDGGDGHPRRLARTGACELVHHPPAVRRPQHERHPGQPGELVRGPLGVAPGDDDPRFRVLGVDPPHRLAARRIGPRRHAARVHDVDVGIPVHRLVAAGGLEQGPDGLGVVLVETAAEGTKGNPLPIRLHRRLPRLNRGAPSNFGGFVFARKDFMRDFGCLPRTLPQQVDLVSCQHPGSGRGTEPPIE